MTLHVYAPADLIVATPHEVWGRSDQGEKDRSLRLLDGGKSGGGDD